MKMILKSFFVLFFFCVFSNAFCETHLLPISQQAQSTLTPDDVLVRLKNGNDRFMHHKRLPIDYIKSAALSSEGQYPKAIILSCIDSRVPPEIIFDQNIGNIFVTRVAANVIDNDVLAGMEYATHVAGAKVIVVLGHRSCGAIKGACEKVTLGHLTQLLHKISPAVTEAETTLKTSDCHNKKLIDLAAENNVRQVVNMIPQQSSVIKKMLDEGKIKIVGGMYDVKTGKARFFNSSSR